MIKTVFFDLDWCILNSESVYVMFDPVVEIINASNASDEFKARYQKSLRGITDFGALDELSEGEIEKIFDLYPTLEVPKGLKTYGDENCIRGLGTTNFLVTTGFPKIQQAKIDQLDISHLFEEIHIDEVGHDVPYRGKEAIFREVIETHTLLPHEVLVVGDKGSSELTAGKNIGAKTAQILRPKIEKWDGADYYIESLCEIKDLLK